MQEVSYRDGSCGQKTQATSTGSCVGRSSDRANGPVWSRKGAGFGSKERPTKSRRTRRLGKFGGHCRYKAGLKLLRRLMWSLRREPRVLVPVRVRVAVGPSKRAGVVPEGGRLRERGMTYWPHRSGRLGKSVGTAITYSRLGTRVNRREGVPFMFSVGTDGKGDAMKLQYMVVKQWQCNMRQVVTVTRT